jgi:hypothetical protein
LLASRFLLTPVDLPVVSRVIEASEKVPCLALSLKLEMPLDSNLEMTATVPKEKQCRSANLERAASKFRRSGWAAWE